MKRMLLALAIALTIYGIFAMLQSQPAWVAPLQSPSLGDLNEPLLIEYPVPGNPEMVVVEGPGRVWFTLPQQNLIGRLVVTSSTDFSVTTYPVPTANSYPYDIDWAAGAIWFTQRDGNNIGRLDPGTGLITEYAIPTPASSPTGIDAVAGNPTRVWFVERDGDRLGTLVFTTTLDYQMVEIPLPAQYAGAQLQDISVSAGGSAWFTAPGLGYLGTYSGVSGNFTVRAAPGGGEPWSIKIAAGGVPVWFTDRSGGRIGGYFPMTIGDFRMFPLPGSGRAPNDLVSMGGKVWFTEQPGPYVTVLSLGPTSFRSFGVGSGALGGIDADAHQQVWFAMSDAMKIGAWRPPYFHRVFLPIVQRG